MSNFAVVFSRIQVAAEIDLLIATDCISEGQNLQDCDFLINYDIHWNPVRIIQRFGRVDRLGSKNDKIQLVNFWPNMELDEYINLEARVSGRMVLLDISATGEENVIEFTDSGKMNDLEYRRKQLEKLQNEVVDIDDVEGGISITDLTLNDFRMDLGLYNAWTDRFTGYECSLLSGSFTIGKAVDRLERLTLCREIESRIWSLRGQLKKVAFNRQVELNTHIKKLEQELEQLAGEL
jgi:SNF2 family DNA or RNA helicase